MDFFKKCAQCGFTYAGSLCPACVPASPEPVGALPGREFPGFEILAILGRGGMGIVYKARQLSSGRLVALKVLSGRKAQGVEARLVREAKTLSALSHPGIVTIYDAGREGDAHYIAMEYVEGESLRQRLGRGTLPVGEAVSIVRQVCDALATAHVRGVVHRDIKPENILLDRAGRAKIVDFGMAKRFGEEFTPLTPSDAALGTGDYAAPEQVECSKSVDPRADLYSVGVVLYEMLTGRLPLGRFDPPSTFSSISSGLDALVLRALSKSPEARPASAAELRDALDRFARPATRWKIWTAVLVGLLLLLSGFLVYRALR